MPRTFERFVIEGSKCYFLFPIKRELFCSRGWLDFLSQSMKDGRKEVRTCAGSLQTIHDGPSVVQKFIQNRSAKVFSRSCDISSSETFSSKSHFFWCLISCQSIEEDWDAFNSLKILSFIERKSKYFRQDSWYLIQILLDTLDCYIF